MLGTDSLNRFFGCRPGRPTQVYSVKRKSLFSSTKYFYNEKKALVYIKEEPKQFENLKTLRLADNPRAIWDISTHPFDKYCLDTQPDIAPLDLKTARKRRPEDQPKRHAPVKCPTEQDFDEQVYTNRLTNDQITVTRHVDWFTLYFVFMWQSEEYRWETGITLTHYKCVRRRTGRTVAEFSRNPLFGKTHGKLKFYTSRRMTSQFREFLMITLLNVFELAEDNQLMAFGW